MLSRVGFCQAQNKALQVDYYAAFREVEEQPMPTIATYSLSVSGDTTSFKINTNEELLNSVGYSVFKNYPKKGILVFKSRIGVNPIMYEEKIPIFEWKNLDGDSTICGYSCQKAETKFRGRTWKVWYSLDLPYSEGPWKLSGLPGLILKAEDSKGDFVFVAQKICKGKFCYSKKEFVDVAKTTLPNYIKDLIEYEKDPSGYMEMTTGVRGSVWIGGVELKPTPQSPCLMEYLDEK